MKTNLIDVWQHVGEAGGEDDSTAKHGETREQGDHGGRLRKESSICVSFSHLLAFYLTQPTEADTQQWKNSHLL